MIFTMPAVLYINWRRLKYREEVKDSGETPFFTTRDCQNMGVVTEMIPAVAASPDPPVQATL